MTPGVALKVAVATRGIQLAPALRETLVATGLDRPSVELLLPDELCVRAPLVTAAPWTLTARNGRHLLVGEPAEVEVRPVPPPLFSTRTTTGGLPMSRVATVHGSHLVVHPSTACGVSIQGSPCRFCLEGARTAGAREAASIADVVEVVRAAFDEGTCDLVYFNSAVFEGDDGGIAFLAPYIEAVRKHFDTLVATQVHPPRDVRWIDRTYAMGVDAISYNLEIFDTDALNRQCIGRMRYIGRDRYLEALAHAAQVFPSGTVWSDLVLGAEAPASTMAGIDALVAMGVVPVVALPAPAPPGIDPTTLPAILGHLYRAVKQRGIPMGWVRDLSLAITPFDARPAAGDGGGLAGTVHQLARSRLGGLAARGLARFRRRLRVRKVSESLGASHL